MQFFRNVNIQWLNLKWYFLALSAVLLAVGWFSVWQQGGFLYGVDFKGGTVVRVKLAEQPELDRLRRVLGPAAPGGVEVTRFDDEDKNLIQVKMQTVESEAEVGFQKMQTVIYQTLQTEYDSGRQGEGQTDINRISPLDLRGVFLGTRVLETMGRIREGATVAEIEQAYDQLAREVIELRTAQGGLIRSLDDVAALPGFPAPLMDTLRARYYCGSFAIVGIDSVGPKIGQQLRDQAFKAVGLALLGMLTYIAIRFKFAYGVAAVVTLVHDVLLTLGIFSLLGMEISLTVVAAMLTLVGYSINDTIIIFDRIRENVKIKRQDRFSEIINASINQTLSRTVITGGTTFVAVLSLYLLGGEVLRGFSLILVMGIVIGTYSSIAISSPLLHWWLRNLGSAKDRKSLHVT